MVASPRGETVLIPYTICPASQNNINSILFLQLNSPEIKISGSHFNSVCHSQSESQRPDFNLKHVSVNALL